MALKDMKLSKKEAKAEISPVKESGPGYPWGLELNLSDEAMGKLGITAKNFAVGETVMIRAKAKVKRLSMSQYEGDKEKNESMDMQITHLEIVSQDKFDEAFKEASEKED